MNSRQPQWNIYEAVVLLDAFIVAQEKARPKSHIIKDVSVALRQMAVNQGLIIDNVFRNAIISLYRTYKRYYYAYCYTALSHYH